MTIDINEAKVERNELGLWASWTVATGVGMLLGYLPYTLLVGDLSLALARVIVPIVAGLFIGVAQWLVLRQYINGSHDWIINHAGGWVAGYTLAFFVAQLLSKTVLGAILGFVLFGLIVSLFQYPVLRREIPHFWIWALANVIGWALGAWLGGVVTGALTESKSLTLITSTLVSVGITGLVAGAITALALIWVVRQPDITVQRS
jgi:hypothetical protein